MKINPDVSEIIPQINELYEAVKFLVDKKYDYTVPKNILELQENKINSSLEEVVDFDFFIKE